MSTKGRWFVTPTARQQWREVIDPRPTSNDEADRELLAWAEDAYRISIQDHPHLVKYRAKNPLRAVFLVDEYDLAPGESPALVGVLRPHARFEPGRFDPLTRKPSRPGRPRSVTQPGERPSEGRPQVRERVPQDVADWVTARQRVEPGYLLNLVREDMRRRA